MKKTYKSQQLKLPLIEQLNKHYIGRFSKDSTKRSVGTSRNSNEIGSKEKQKKSPKLSKFNPFIQNLLLSQHRSLNKKELSKSFGHTFSQTLIDFEEKIKQNKILLKKFQLQKQIEKHNLQINQRRNKKHSTIKKPYSLEKENSNNGFINSNNNKILLSAVNSRKHTKHDSPKNKLDQPGKENKRYFVNMDQENSKLNQVKAVTEIDEVISEERRNQQNPLDRLNKKLKPNDIFQNIHVLLKGLQSEGFLPEKQIKMEKVHQKLLKYKKKLQKIQPGSQFLSSINKKIKNNQSLPLIPKLDHDNFGEKKFKRQTMYPWQRFVINSKKEINKFPSSFNEEIEKVDLYLNKSSNYLEQLLKNRICMLDLALLKKINSKKAKNRPKLFRKD